MKKIHETLLILDHFNGVIGGRVNYCKRNIHFNLNNCVTEKINEKIKLGIDINSIDSSEISRSCTDSKIILNCYISLNIIDMFSFNDEYKKYFNPVNFDDEVLKKRISLVLQKNSKIKKKVNWTQIGKFRNNVLAHNLRDKQNNYNLSVPTLKELTNLMNNLTEAIKNFEVVLEMFENINSEFQIEILEANNELKKQYVLS